jgi:alpha-glucosidase
LHLFVKQQPDLNYRNPEVVEALMNTMRFWLDKGVDGFRVDVIGLMMKDPDLRRTAQSNWDGVNPQRASATSTPRTCRKLWFDPQCAKFLIL